MTERQAYANDPAGWQQLQADCGGPNEPFGRDAIWPAATPLTDTARAELLRCADAFENTARRLREIVGP